MKEVKKEIWTIKKILTWTEKFFAQKGLDTPRLDAEILLAHALLISRIKLYIDFERPLTKDELEKFRKIVLRRANNEPTAYIIGKKEFMGLPFKVNKNVLIPRPETEILVEIALNRLLQEKAPTILDIGTGTGAIINSLLYYHQELLGTGVDISKEAIMLAKENAEHLKVHQRARFLEGDLFSPLKEKEKYNAIISNPPYIPTKDIPSLMKDVKDYEPHLALDGGKDGLDFYRKIIKKAGTFLKKDGFLALEIGEEEAEPIISLQAKPFTKSEIHLDLNGKKRVIIFFT